MSILKDKILELKKTHTNEEVLKLLISNWFNVTKSYIEKITVKNRIITNKCEKCWKTFYFFRKKKVCLECSWYKYDKKKCTQINYEYKIELQEIMNETIRQTWLTKKQIKKQLLKNTHTEIRNHFNN